MSLHLQRFVDRIQAAESRGKKDVVIPMDEAQNIHADLTRLLLELETTKTAGFQSNQDQVIEVKISGGSF